MIFTGSKQKRKKFAISGYSIVIMLFLIACYLNISGSALFAHAILILSIFAFFVMYAALKRGESGILIADNKKLTLSIGFRIQKTNDSWGKL